jgi:hypothetical protein
MPRYAALIYEAVDAPTENDEAAWAEIMTQYGEFGAVAGAAGVIGGGEALQPPVTATTVQVKGGKGGEVTLTDGPYAEAKEVLGGFYLLDCANLDEAIAWASKIPGAWTGKVEVRPCIDFTSGE